MSGESGENKQTEKVRIAKIKKQANDEFKAWKKELCKIVNTESRLVMYKTGTWQFILPSRLVKLVWSTTLQERIKAMLAGDVVSLEDAKGKALKSIRDEMDQAYAEFIEAPEAQAAKTRAEAEKRAKQEEAEAAATLAKLREEMVRLQEGKDD